MKKIEKKKLVLWAAILIAVVLLIWGASKVLNFDNKKGTDKVGEFVVVAEDGTKVNNSAQLKKEKSIDGLKLTNITLVQSNGISSLKAEVKNNTGKDMEEFKVNLTILGKEGQIIFELPGSMPGVANGETTLLNAQVTEDISNAYDFKISRVGSEE